MSENLETFRARFGKLAQQYNIEKSELADFSDAQRIAHLASEELIKLLGAKFGQDAECEFFNWAREEGIKCDVIPSKERTKDGKVKHRVYPGAYRKLLENISFKKFIDAANRSLSSGRKPILKREPVVRLRNKKF